MDAGQADGAVDVGLVGLGSIGRRLAAQFHELPGSRLVALADVDEAALSETGERFDVPADRRFTDYAAMLAASDLDAVTIATPNGLHHEQATLALDHDLHVLCEKPLAPTVDAALELTERAAASDRTFMVGYQRHCNPAYRAAREQFASGERTPRFVTGEITHDWREHFESMDDWRMNPELSGGGHLLNVGTHVIDAILWTTGLTPTHVDAVVEFHDEAQQLDRQSTINLRFAEGTIANVADTGVVARTREHVHIWDGEGAVYLEGREWDDRTGHEIDADGTERDPYRSYSRRLAKGSAFLEAVRTGEAPPATVVDGLRATVVTVAAYESGRTGETVDLADRYPAAAEYL